MDNQIEAARDVEGYLIDPEAWNTAVANELAAEEDLQLSDAYWPILHFMHDYWREHQGATDVRHVVGCLASHQEIDTTTAKERLFE